MEVGKIFALQMKQFKDAIPLMVKLKNNALRPRHWIYLMEITGHLFHMKPDNCLLGDIFAMKLYNHRVSIYIWYVFINHNILLFE